MKEEKKNVRTLQSLERPIRYYDPYVEVMFRLRKRARRQSRRRLSCAHCHTIYTLKAIGCGWGGRDSLVALTQQIPLYSSEYESFCELSVCYVDCLMVLGFSTSGNQLVCDVFLRGHTYQANRWFMTLGKSYNALLCLCCIYIEAEYNLLLIGQRSVSCLYIK